MGHRDSTPEYADEYKAWTENFISYSRLHHERWGWPKEMVDVMEQCFQLTLEIIAEEDAVPVEPSPIDGYTIYWDKAKRFRELLCQYLEVPYDENVNCDGALLAQRMLENDLAGWQDFLMTLTYANAARYGMPAEWAEAVRTRMESPDPPPEPATQEALEERFLLLYPFT